MSKSYLVTLLVVPLYYYLLNALGNRFLETGLLFLTGYLILVCYIILSSKGKSNKQHSIWPFLQVLLPILAIVLELFIMPYNDGKGMAMLVYFITVIAPYLVLVLIASIFMSKKMGYKGSSLLTLPFATLFASFILLLLFFSSEY